MSHVHPISGEEITDDDYRPLPSERTFEVTVRVTLDDVMDGAKRGKVDREWNDDLFRFDYFPDFEIDKVCGLSIVDYCDDLDEAVAERMIADSRWGSQL